MLIGRPLTIAWGLLRTDLVIRTIQVCECAIQVCECVALQQLTTVQLVVYVHLEIAKLRNDLRRGQRSWLSAKKGSHAAKRVQPHHSTRLMRELLPIRPYRRSRSTTCLSASERWSHTRKFARFRRKLLS